MQLTQAFATVLLALVVPAPAVSENNLQALLKGHSVVMQYTEMVEGRRKTGKRVWTQAIYVSSKGRLFVHVDVAGSRRRGPKHLNITPDSNNSGGATPFKWTKNGLAREWRDHRGRSLRQTIDIARSGKGFTCKATITRYAFASQANHQICTVVVGNPLEGM